MSYIYLIVCFAIAVFLPHLIVSTVSTSEQIFIQILFVLTGLAGAYTFSE